MNLYSTVRFLYCADLKYIYIILMIEHLNCLLISDYVSLHVLDVCMYNVQCTALLACGLISVEANHFNLKQK